ncbi:MAG TPA: acyl-ACP--UDP-N-acetylglucosamine O-acyltransferase [Calditrichia bacterium]|nr:acyl-ACP--UDP-N-acetylglucosamine O-acyltransferase [Calditrichia bacterium]
MTKIHPTALVDPHAELGTGVEVGPFAVIESDVQIGDNCEIHSHVKVSSGTRLGEGVIAHQGAVLGSAPQDLKYKDEKTYLEIGDKTVVREYATINRGTDYNWKTEIGKNCLLMAYVHVAHDCILGNNVIIANSVQMAGHVVIEDFVGVGGLTAIHQFVHIGKHAFIGGGFRIIKDVPPFILAMGEPLQFGGLNSVGLTRRGFTQEQLLEMKRAYKTIYRSNFTRTEALDHLRNAFAPSPIISDIADFLEKSDRGLIKG